MTLLVVSIFHMTRKIVSEMTYNVSMGTLNPTIPYHLSCVCISNLQPQQLTTYPTMPCPTINQTACAVSTVAVNGRCLTSVLYTVVRYRHLLPCNYLVYLPCSCCKYLPSINDADTLWRFCGLLLFAPRYFHRHSLYIYIRCTYIFWCYSSSVTSTV